MKLEIYDYALITSIIIVSLYGMTQTDSFTVGGEDAVAEIIDIWDFPDGINAVYSFTIDESVYLGELYSNEKNFSIGEKILVRYVKNAPWISTYYHWRIKDDLP